VQSDWSATNNTGITNQNLYLVFSSPTPNSTVTEAKDVGLGVELRREWTSGLGDRAGSEQPA
jgi:hypothetical protein